MLVYMKAIRCLMYRVSTSPHSASKRLECFSRTCIKVVVAGGSLIIIESNDPARRFVPELPSVNALFDELKKKQKKKDGRRDAGSLLKQIAPTQRFRIINNTSVIVPSTLPTYKDLFHNSYHDVFQVACHHYGVSIQLDELQRELNAWHSVPASYAQIGVTLSCYQKEDGTEG